LGRVFQSCAAVQVGALHECQIGVLSPRALPERPVTKQSLGPDQVRNPLPSRHEHRSCGGIREKREDVDEIVISQMSCQPSRQRRRKGKFTNHLLGWIKPRKEADAYPLVLSALAERHVQEPSTVVIGRQNLGTETPGIECTDGAKHPITRSTACGTHRW